jgi:hypothetical protein
MSYFNTNDFQCKRMLSIFWIINVFFEKSDPDKINISGPQHSLKSTVYILTKMANNSQKMSLK